MIQTTVANGKTGYSATLSDSYKIYVNKGYEIFTLLYTNTNGTYKSCLVLVMTIYRYINDFNAIPNNY